MSAHYLKPLSRLEKCDSSVEFKMMIDEAINIVLQPKGVKAVAFLRSINLLSEPKNDDHVPISVLLTALRYCSQFRDNVTPMKEVIVLTLYRRTERSRKPCHAPYEDFITDENDWIQYLRKTGFNNQVEHTP